jgi:transmembrane sensor
MNMQETISDIIAKKLSDGHLTVTEQQLLNEWLLLPGNVDQYAELEKVWNLTAKVTYNFQPDVDAEWAHFKTIRNNSSANKRFLKPSIIWTSSIAASVALIIGLFFILSNSGNQIYNYSATALQQKIVLPDSTIVWLNKNSNLTYTFDKKDNERLVNLAGEALFQVTKTGQAFIISTPQQVVTKVLGTEFNLKAYANDIKVDLVVISGKVSFGKSNQNTIITKGQQASYLCNQNKLAEVLPADKNLIAWKTGTFNFNNDPLTKVAEQIGSYLGKTIEMPNEANKLQYSGSFSEPTAESFAQVISVALNWEFSISDTKIVFTSR